MTRIQKQIRNRDSFDTDQYHQGDSTFVSYGNAIVPNIEHKSPSPKNRENYTYRSDKTVFVGATKNYITPKQLKKFCRATRRDTHPVFTTGTKFYPSPVGNAILNSEVRCSAWG